MLEGVEAGVEREEGGVVADVLRGLGVEVLEEARQY